MELTVATFNIRNCWGLDGRNSWPFRRRATAEAIRSLDADVLEANVAHPRPKGRLPSDHWPVVAHLSIF